MADKKISALTAATTPLAGTEVLPIVQSSSTVKVAVSNLTAGRAVNVGSLTSTGNILLDGSGNPTITLKTSGAGNNPLYRIQASTNYWDMIGIFSNADDPFRIRYNDTDFFQIANTGGVSIGNTTDPGAGNLNVNTKANIGTTTNRDTLTVSQGISMLGGGVTSEKYSGYDLRTWASSYLGSGGTKTVCNISSPNGGYAGGGLVRITTSYQYRGGGPGNNYAEYIVTTNSTATANLVTSAGTYPTVTVSTVGSGSTATLDVIVNYNGDSHVQVIVEVFGLVNTWGI